MPEAFGQAQALAGIAVDLPRPLAGEGDADQTHEGGHVLGGIAQQQADLVREMPLMQLFGKLLQDIFGR